MNLHDLIKSNNWLSTRMTLLDLYPDQKEITDEYRSVIENLELVEPVNDEMLIVLTEYKSSTVGTNESTST